MIRKHKEIDLEDIIKIWLQASPIAHPFLNASFVKKVEYDMRTHYIPNSDTWVYVKNNTIIGFISMIGNEIGGLFVLPIYHSKGIGTQLVNFIRESHNELEVEVFKLRASLKTSIPSYC